MRYRLQFNWSHEDKPQWWLTDNDGNRLHGPYPTSWTAKCARRRIEREAADAYDFATIGVSS
jgi:hypothetical protein